MKRKIKIAVCGAANPHIPGYCRGFANNPHYPWEIVALAEPDPVLLGRVREILRDKPVAFYSDYRKMLDEHPGIEAVQIGSDNKFHFEMFRETMSRELAIYSTKVPTMNEAEGTALLKLAENYPKPIQVELELHFSPQFRHARELVRSGKLGVIESVYLTNISQSPCNYFPNWGNPELSYGTTVPIRPGSRTFRGGALTDHPHPFDLVRWITGSEFSWVYAESARNQRPGLRVEDHIAMTGKLSNQANVFINPSYSNLEEAVPTRRLLWPKSLECNLKITGSKGYYAADYFHSPLFVVAKGHQSPDRLIVDGAGGYGNSQEDSLIGSFASCVRGERKTPESTLADGMAAVRVMNAVYESVYHDEVRRVDHSDSPNTSA